MLNKIDWALEETRRVIMDIIEILRGSSNLKCLHVKFGDRSTANSRRFSDDMQTRIKTGKLRVLSLTNFNPTDDKDLTILKQFIHIEDVRMETHQSF